MKTKKLFRILIFIAVILIGYYGYKNNLDFRKIQFGVDENDSLYRAFVEKFPDKEVIKTAKEDLNSDNEKDLIIIYRNKKEDKSYMTAVIAWHGKNIFIKEILAPYENHRIEFKNIDNKPPTEFIVSGSRKGRYGYGIFRLKDNRIHNIFSEGMELC